MSGRNTAVFGVYPTHESADAAVDTLSLEQTGAEDISSIGETKGDFSNSDRPTALAEHVAPVEVVKH